MHPDEIETDVALVRRLLAGQFPQWAGLAIDPVVSYGTDHDIYRLGDDLGAGRLQGQLVAEPVGAADEDDPEDEPEPDLSNPADTR